MEEAQARSRSPEETRRVLNPVWQGGATRTSRGVFHHGRRRFKVHLTLSRQAAGVPHRQRGRLAIAMGLTTQRSAHRSGVCDSLSPGRRRATAGVSSSALRPEWAFRRRDRVPERPPDFHRAHRARISPRHAVTGVGSSSPFCASAGGPPSACLLLHRGDDCRAFIDWELMIIRTRSFFRRPWWAWRRSIALDPGRCDLPGGAWASLFLFILASSGRGMGGCDIKLALFMGGCSGRCHRGHVLAFLFARW